jgi:hypothetical protein
MLIFGNGGGHLPAGIALCKALAANQLWIHRPASPLGIAFATLRPACARGLVKLRCFATGRILLKLRELIEFTAIISAHSPNLIEGTAPLADVALRQYRHLSKSRSTTWLADLELVPRRLAAATGPDRQAIWDGAEELFIDVMAGDLLARVWGAVLTARGRAQHEIAVERAGREALNDQLPPHQQVLKLMVDGPYLTLERVVRLDRIRRKLERWTDLLAGHLVRRFGLADFAYDVDRALDFGEEQLGEQSGTRTEQIWQLYFLCLRTGFPDIELPSGDAAASRRELIGAILRSLPSSIFLDDGLLTPVRLQRCLQGGTVREGPPGVASLWQAFVRDGRCAVSRPRTRRNGG